MVYVMSDIHGHKKNFDSILDQIQLSNEDTLYILGDVIDRNPHGIELLQRIIDAPNIKMLMGNHEYMMMNTICSDDPFICQRSFFAWYNNGGGITYDTYSKLSEYEKEKIVTFLKNLPYQFDITVGGKKYCLVHAAPKAFISKYFNEWEYVNENEFLVWHRINTDTKFDKDNTLIFGHTPVILLTNRNGRRVKTSGDAMEIWRSNNLIDIDCGCAFLDGEVFGTKGRLACLRLDDNKVFYSN